MAGVVAISLSFADVEPTDDQWTASCPASRRKWAQRAVRFTSTRSRINSQAGSRVLARGARRRPGPRRYPVLRYTGNRPTIALCAPSRHGFDQHPNRHAHAANAGLAAHDLGVHRDASELLHVGIIAVLIMWPGPRSVCEFTCSIPTPPTPSPTPRLSPPTASFSPRLSPTTAPSLPCS